MIVKELISKKMYKEYSITIPYKDVVESIDDKIKTLLPTVELPGFRKGKAPLNIVKKKYENNVLAEVIENIAKKNTQKILEDNKLKILRQPKVEISKYEKDNPLELKLKIDLEPQIKLIDFSKIITNKYKIKIEKKDYKDNYDQFLSSQNTFIKIEDNRPIKMSDKIIVDINSNDEFVPDFLKNQESVSIFTDSDYQILPDISKEIIKRKLKINDKITLPFDIKEILKQKDKKIAKFNITIKNIEEKKPIVINKEFLDKNNFQSENDFKEMINKKLDHQYEHLTKEIEKKQLYDLLESKHSFDIPEGIYEEEFSQIWQRVQNAKKNNTIDEDDKKLSETNLKKRYAEIATRRVKLAIIIQKIAEINSISVSNEELSKGMMQYASQYPGQEKQIMDFFKKNPAQIESVRAPIFENKVLDSVLAKTNKKNQPISMKDFIKLQEDTFSFKRKK
tara:strand:- start:1149 stop:2498 length:1350 start_codon:yes stop_codon:yes gene_type:complete